MTIEQCPKHPQFWRPEDVYEVNCPHCRASVEFFKDDPGRKCASCGKK